MGGMTPTQYARFIEERERKIKNELFRVAREAIEAHVAKDADGEDKLGLKYVTGTGTPPFTLRLGFKEGLGFDLSVGTAYKPTPLDAVAF